MQFFDLIVFELVGGGQFGDLLVEEGDIREILVVDGLFLISIFVEGLPEGANFVVIGLACQIHLISERSDLPVSIINNTFHFLLSSLELLPLKLNFMIFFLHQFIKFLLFVFQSIDKILVLSFHSGDIGVMDMY